MMAVPATVTVVLWQLTQSEIPGELRCERFGVKHYHHPELLEALAESAPETKLLALIDECFKDGISNIQGLHFIGTAEQLQIAAATLYRKLKLYGLTRPKTEADPPKSKAGKPRRN